ncbi:MAG TPA: hypothetical protein VFT74_19800 [Isosphaeraceae bacterium]|nr:hypothetical protein [Isosphaeraceae bacterium]
MPFYRHAKPEAQESRNRLRPRILESGWLGAVFGPRSTCRGRHHRGPRTDPRHPEPSPARIGWRTRTNASLGLAEKINWSEEVWPGSMEYPAGDEPSLA